MNNAQIYNIGKSLIYCAFCWLSGPGYVVNLSFTVKDNRLAKFRNAFWPKHPAEHAQRQPIRNEKGDTHISGYITTTSVCGDHKCII